MQEGVEYLFYLSYVSNYDAVYLVIFSGKKLSEPVADKESSASDALVDDQNVGLRHSSYPEF